MKQTQARTGYWPGCKQPSQAMTIRIRCNAEPAPLSSLDQWLVSRLGLDQVPPAPQPLPQPRAVAELAWRALIVSVYLLQESRLPVFDPGQILGIDHHPDTIATWDVKVRVTCLDLMPGNALPLALDAALRIVARGLLQPADDAGLEAVLRAIENTVIKPLRADSFTGISTLPILREAYRLDIPFRPLGAGVYQLGWGSRSRKVDRSVLDTDSAIGARMSSQKHWAAQLLRTAGLPAPEHSLVKSEPEAREAAHRLGWPVVVKPADRERSEGVTVSIHDEAGLGLGYQHALRYSKLILVERQVPGICYRLMVGNARLLYAVRRNPKSVTGDGRHCVAQLIDLERQRELQAPPWRRGKPISLDALCLETLAAQGLDAQYIPHAGEKVKLRPIESSEWGGDVVTVTSEVHPDNFMAALRAARLFGLDNAGIDIISPDISQPWHSNGAIINEVNFAPHFGATLAAREMMPVFLKNLIAGDGRIRIEAFVGGSEALKAGLLRRSELASDGLACWCTSHAESFNASGDPFVLRANGLFARTQALLLNPEVEALILVVQTDELLRTGLPADRLTQIHRCAGNLLRQDRNSLQNGADGMSALLRLLNSHAIAALES